MSGYAQWSEFTTYIVGDAVVYFGDIFVANVVNTNVPPLPANPTWADITPTGVITVVAGDNIDIDATIPTAPIISVEPILDNITAVQSALNTTLEIVGDGSGTVDIQSGGASRLVVGPSGLDAQQSVLSNVSELQIQDNADNIGTIKFQKAGLDKATIEYNGVGTNDKLAVSATSINLDSSVGNLEMDTTLGGVRLQSENVAITFARENATPVLDTQVQLNAAGEVAIGALGLGTTPALRFIGNSGGSASLSYDDTGSQLEMNGKLRFPTTLPQSSVAPTTGDDLVNKTYADALIGSGVVNSVSSGTNINVNNTNPAAPIVNLGINTTVNFNNQDLTNGKTINCVDENITTSLTVGSTTIDGVYIANGIISRAGANPIVLSDVEYVNGPVSQNINLDIAGNIYLNGQAGGGEIYMNSSGVVDIIGNLTVNNELTDSAGSAGLAGQVLTVGGSGYPVWAAPSGGATISGTNDYFLFKSGTNAADTASYMYQNGTSIQTTVPVAVPELRVNDTADDIATIVFQKAGTYKAQIEYNGSGTNDRLNMQATEISVDGTYGNFNSVATGVIVQSQGVPLAIKRETAAPALDTQILLNASGNVQIGQFGLATTPSLSLVDNAGTAATLSYDSANAEIDVNRKVNVSGDVQTSTKMVAQGATPEFRLNDAGGNVGAGFAYTDATNLTELYCTDDLEFGPGGNTTINAGTGAFEFKNGGTQNFLVSGGGNTMRLNAPSGAQKLNLNTAAVSQQSEIQFTYGTPGSGTAGYGIYRPVNTGNLAFYSYPLARNQLVLEGSVGDTQFIGTGGNVVANVNAAGQLTLGATVAGAGSGFLNLYRTVNDANATGINLYKSRSGGNTLSGDGLGYVQFIGYANSGYRSAAFINIIQEAASAGNNIPCSMRFATTATASPAGAEERMRLTQNGTLAIGNTSPPSASGPRIYSADDTADSWNGFAYFGKATSSRGVVAGTLIAGVSGRVAVIGGHNSTLTAWDKLTINPGGQVGVGTVYNPIYQLELNVDSAFKPGSAGLWAYTSDARIKKNIVDADLGICFNNIKNMRLRRFEWDPEYYDEKSLKDRKVVGFIAQEVKDVFPKAVEIHPTRTFSKTLFDESGNMILDEKTKLPKTTDKILENVHSLNGDQIMNTHIGATQMLIQKVEALEAQNALLMARLEALEAKMR